VSHAATAAEGSPVLATEPRRWLTCTAQPAYCSADAAGTKARPKEIKGFPVLFFKKELLAGLMLSLP